MRALAFLPVAAAWGGDADRWPAGALPGGTAGVLEAAGLDPRLPRCRSLFALTRRLHPTYGDTAAASAGARQAVRAWFEAGPDTPRVARVDGPRGWGEAPYASAIVAEAGGPGDGPPDTVPLLLAPAAWSRLAPARGDASPAEAILADRGASLLYQGLAQLDVETRAALAREADVLREVARRRSEPFAVFAGAFRVRNGRVDAPGGPEGEALWEGLVGRTVGEPGEFLRRLLDREDGRRLLFYDAVDRLEPPGRRFALGLAEPDPERREARFRALASVFAQGEAWWRPAGGAFNRPEVDAATVLRLVRAEAEGRMASPASRAFWEAAFAEEVVRDPAVLAAPERVDAAWLAEQVGLGPVPLRWERLEKLAFAQRVFGEAPPEALPDALLALRGLSRQPALVRALDRMGIVSPALLAQAVRRAEQLAVLTDPTAAALAHGQFQGALALLERARLRHALDAAEAEGLVASLVAVPFAAGRYGPAVAGWLRDTALPRLAASTYGAVAPGSAEEVLARALSGSLLTAEPGRSFEWEGLHYRADPGEADRRRIEAVRRRQGGNRLDAVLAFLAATERVEAARGRDALAEATAALEAVARPLVPVTFPDEKPLDLRALAAATRRDEAGRARVGEKGAATLREAGERLLAEALLSIAYAPHLGPPGGPALAGSNVALRHRFLPSPWNAPVEPPWIGVAWRVTGSLLGLDTALAGFSLRRLSTDVPSRPPGLDVATRLGLARTVTFMDPWALDDRAQGEMAAAIERGRERARALAGRADAVDAAAREAGLEAWRHRALEWAVVHEPEALPRFFSLLQLFRLGGPGDGPWDAWGTPSLGEDGAWRLRLPPPRPFDDLAGRRLGLLLSARFADLGLLAAVALHERGLPASLGPSLLAYLVQDLVDGCEPRGHDDWLALAQHVRDVPGERLDDMVAALVGDGPLLPAPEPGAAP